MIIRNYIEKIAPFALSWLDKVKNGTAEAVLFGASGKGKEFLSEYKDTKINFIYFCDDNNSLWGSRVGGVPVISPERLDALGYEGPIFITSKWSDPISEKLFDMGFENVYHRFMLDYLLHIDELQKAYDLFDDELSKNVLAGLIKYAFTQRSNIFEEITISEDQYFLMDLFEFGINECIVDGGAYVGDTIQNFISRIGEQFGEIHCFEPDNENYEKMVNNLEAMQGVQGLIHTYNLGLFDSVGKVRFSCSHNSAACISDEGDHYINVTSIDACLAGDVTMIKLDVEGAEQKTIMGAKNVIQRNKPKLAICNYHIASDLWKIPLMIKELVPDYKLYLRHHNRKCWYESVVYAKI